MKDEHVRIVGIVIAAVLTAFIVSVYVRQPKNPGEVFPRQVDREAFERGRILFHQDEFVAARLEFERADPGRADAKTQFYTAYSYYREGCGFFRQNDELLEEGLEPVERAIARATSGDFPVDDRDIDLKTPEALKEEIEAGLDVGIGDIILGGCK